MQFRTQMKSLGHNFYNLSVHASHESVKIMDGLGRHKIMDTSSANTGSANNVAFVVRSLAAFMFILSLGLWPAPEGAMVDGQPFSSLGSFMLYRYQTLAVGLLAIGIAVAGVLIARRHITETARIHARQMAIAEERYRREIEYRENLDLVHRMERAQKEAKGVADMARAIAGELAVCVANIWARVEAIHGGLAGSNGSDDGNGDHTAVASAQSTPRGVSPVVFPMVAEKLGALGWDLASQLTTFHAQSESFSAASFGRNGFRSAPQGQGIAMLRHALQGAILQNRLQTLARQIDAGNTADFEASLDAQALEDLHKHFGILEDGSIDPEKWEHFAAAEADERADAATEELLTVVSLSDSQEPRQQAML